MSKKNKWVEVYFHLQFGSAMAVLIDGSNICVGIEGVWWTLDDARKNAPMNSRATKIAKNVMASPNAKMILPASSWLLFGRRSISTNCLAANATGSMNKNAMHNAKLFI
jgi:hypothetical protein